MSGNYLLHAHQASHYLGIPLKEFRDRLRRGLMPLTEATRQEVAQAVYYDRAALDYDREVLARRQEVRAEMYAVQSPLGGVGGDPLTRKCIRCGSPPGRGCRTSGGYFARPHAQR